MVFHLLVVFSWCPIFWFLVFFSFSTSAKSCRSLRLVIIFSFYDFHWLSFFISGFFFMSFCQLNFSVVQMYTTCHIYIVCCFCVYFLFRIRLIYIVCHQISLRTCLVVSLSFIIITCRFLQLRVVLAFCFAVVYREHCHL